MQLEKDLLTARISQALHPYGKGNIFVRNEPFEAIGELEDKDKYDLITSNIPLEISWSMTESTVEVRMH